MKYVHDGTRYLIFSGYEGLTHAEVARFLRPAAPAHAGFVMFAPHPTDEALVYGRSMSLNLGADPFEYEEKHYVGLSANGYAIISNDPVLLEEMRCQGIEEAVWKWSEEGHGGESPVMYPGHSNMTMRSSALLQD